MSKLSEAIDENRRKQKEYGLESTRVEKPKSYLRQSIDSIRQGKGIPRRTTPTTAPYTGGIQTTKPERQIQKDVGTAVSGGPHESAHDDEPDYLSNFQPASNYAAGYQGAPQSTGIPYAAGLQAGLGKKTEQKQVEPAPVEEPEDEFAGMSSQELRTLHDETKTKRDEAGKALGKITISQEENPEGVDQAEVDRLLGEYEALKNQADRISGRLSNQTGAENLGKAMEDPSSYQYAKELETDLWKLNTYLNMDLPDETAQGYARELKEKYGTEDLFGLLPQLAAKQKEAVGRLSEAGVDYEKASYFEDQLKRNEEYKQRTEEQQKFAEEHPFRASLATIPANAVQGFEYFDALLSNWGHNDPDDLDNYRPLDVTEMYATNFVRNVRGTVAKKIEESPVFQDVELGGQNVGAFLYQTGMSMGDFLFNSFLTGNFSGGLGGTGSEAAKQAAQNLSLAIMGSSAAANTTVEAIERGLSNRQAYTLGAIAGAAEVFTERFSLEALLDGSWEKNAVQYVLKNAFTEGSEEVGSDLINLLADVLVAQDQSEWRQSIAAYEQQGLSEGEAFTQAMKDQAVSMGMDFLGGAFSGGIMSGSNVAINGANAQTGSLVSDATADEMLRNESTVSFLSKHGGLELKKGMTPEQKRAAIRQAVENVVHKEKAASVEGDGEIHYSLKAFEDGKRFVDVDTDQDQFDGLSEREQGRLATQIIKKKFGGKVIGLENRAYVNSRTAGEYGFPLNHLKADEHEAKMRASTELDNLMDAGTNFRTEPDGRDGHIHEEATGDFQYFDTIFKVGKEYYSGVINIMPTENGLVLKDITKIRNITQDISSSYGDDPQATFLRDTSMDSISQKRQKGNKKVPTTKTDMQAQQHKAQFLTQADAKRFAAETGTENGLVLDDYVQKHIRRETAERLNTLARALGTRVRFVGSIRGGTANASIQGNEVQIERYNPNPVTFLLGHELTHRMQQLSPEEYTRFKEAIRSEAEKEAQGLYTLYQNRGEKIDFEGAMDEATANYAGRLLEEGPVLDEFIQKHRTDKTLLEKLLDAVRDMISKLTGAERKQAETAEGKLLAAMEETARQVKEDGGEESPTVKSTQEQFLLKTVGGKEVVWIDKSPLTNKELNSHTAVAQYIAQHIGEVYTIIESGQSVYIGDDLPGEYTQSKYTTYLLKKKPAGLRVKNRAISGFGELIETATNRRWEKTRHKTNKDAKYGIYRYDSTFAFPVKDRTGAVTKVRVFDVELVIRNASDGKKYLYDIVNIKENTTSAIDLTQREARMAAHRADPRGDVSKNNISQDN